MFYTAAGGTNPESEGKEFTIRTAYSTDGGNTYVKFGEPVLESLAGENRDPKVFWHEESAAYIMVLWVENEDFAIFRSTDLAKFSLSQRLTLEGGFECPDLFRLAVKGSEEQKWVFWAADGSYYMGEFDGYSFTQTLERKLAYESRVENDEHKSSLAYAAQTYFGVGERVMSVPWLRTECVEEQITGVMGLPRYFSLIKKDEEYVLCQELPDFVREGLERKQLEELVTECRLDVEYSPDKATLTIRSAKRTIVLENMDTEDLDIVYDKGVMEIANGENTKIWYCDFPELR